ncbi:MAG: ribosome maturation factor RimP [Acidimicrobiia bacterium]
MAATDNSITERVRDIVQPIVADLGLELYDVEYAGGMVKVTIDTPPGSSAGVDVDQLSRATRLISRDLDHIDPIPGQYTLEVSSPGLERNLRLPRHFQREIGKQIAVRLNNPVDGERRVNGMLVAADETTFTVTLDSGQQRIVAIDQVDRARTVFVWEAAPKPGRGAKGTRGKKAGSGSSAADSSVPTADLWADSDADETLEPETESHDDQEP